MNTAQNHEKVLRLCRGALIAAIYVALCTALAPLSFGPVQIRFSEALTLLAIFGPEYIIGVTIGCFLSNLVGMLLTGLPMVDLFVGTATTLAAALVTYKLAGVRWKGMALAASVPPVLFNAVIIGIELTILYTPGVGIGMYLFNMVTVGLGQLVSCTILGVALVRLVEANPALRRAFGAKALKQ